MNKNPIVKEPQRVESNRNANSKSVEERTAQPAQAIEQSKGKTGVSVGPRLKEMQRREHNRQMGWITPPHLSRSPKRKENLVQSMLNPFNVLCERSTTEVAHSSPVKHEGGIALPPLRSG